MPPSATTARKSICGPPPACTAQRSTSTRASSFDVVKMPFDEALGLVMDGTIKDSKTQVALLKYAQLRAKSLNGR